MKDCKAIINNIHSLIRKYKHKREKPLVIQMPITSRCNSRCKTCNIWKSKSTNDIDPIALEKALSDPFFDIVQTVGVNGGEITLVPNFLDVLKAILTLPSLHNVYLISNGLLPEKLYSYMSKAKTLCNDKKVYLHLCLSVDGYGDVHDIVRGVPGAFVRTKTILDEFKKDYHLYCHSFSIGSTISKYNIGFIRETENFLNNYPFPIEYHLAVPNRRIGTYNDYEDYYVLQDEESRLLAAEYFFTQYLQETNNREKQRLFAIYYFLKNKGKKRLCCCDYLDRDVTIDENLNLRLCATASGVIGNLKNESATKIIASNKTRKARQEIKKRCDTCIHYAYHPLTIKGSWIFSKVTNNYQDVLVHYHNMSVTKGNRFITYKKRVQGVFRCIKSILENR